MYIRASVHAYMCMLVCVGMCVLVCACICVHSYMCVCMRECVCSYVYICVCIYMYAYVHACTYVGNMCTCVCMYYNGEDVYACGLMLCVCVLLCV